jgi:hypothetical protein
MQDGLLLFIEELQRFKKVNEGERERERRRERKKCACHL